MKPSSRPSTSSPSCPAALPFPLTAMRMRLTCVPETPVHLEGLKAGTLLRGALLSVMLRTTCPLTGVPYERRKDVDPEHVATCAVCWLIKCTEQLCHGTPHQNAFGHPTHTSTIPFERP